MMVSTVERSSGWPPRWLSLSERAGAAPPLWAGKQERFLVRSMPL